MLLSGINSSTCHSLHPTLVLYTMATLTELAIPPLSYTSVRSMSKAVNAYDHPSKFTPSGGEQLAGATRKTDSMCGQKKLSFIICGAPSDPRTAAARKKVRSQAARRSAEQRKATIAQRKAGRSPSKQSPALEHKHAHRGAVKRCSRPEIEPQAPAETPSPSSDNEAIAALSPHGQDVPNAALAIDMLARVERCKPR